MNQDTKNFILLALGIIVAVVTLGFILVKSVNNSEMEECMKWQQEAQEIRGYWITNWQSEQCLAHNLPVDAPIK